MPGNSKGLRIPGGGERCAGMKPNTFSRCVMHNCGPLWLPVGIKEVCCTEDALERGKQP